MRRIRSPARNGGGFVVAAFGGVTEKAGELASEAQLEPAQAFQRHELHDLDQFAHLADTGKIIESMKTLIGALGDAAVGDDRAAAVARDWLRGMIDRVIVTSKPATGREDERGCGPVTVRVEGSLTRVVA